MKVNPFILIEIGMGLTLAVWGSGILRRGPWRRRRGG